MMAQSDDRNSSPEFFIHITSDGNYSVQTLGPLEYRPLDSQRKEIRLVQAATIDDSGPIILHLAQVSLLDEPQYCALSYTWGSPFDGLPPEWDDPKATKRIIVNNCTMQVRWNLEAALRVFCASEFYGNTLWIDAICINQSDLDERNQQVELMADIYGNSKITQVWLGPNSRDSDLAFETVRDFYKGYEKRPKELKEELVDLSYAEAHSRFEDEELGAHDIVKRLEAVETLLLRHWWFRAWVVQEVAVAWDCRISCGEQELITFPILKGFQTVLGQHYHMHDTAYSSKHDYIYPLISRLHRALEVGLGNLLAQIWSYDHDEGSPGISLERSLSLLRPADATDVRDKVYAARSLTQDTDLISVDYRASVVDLFSSVTMKLIERRKSLHILSYCSPSKIPGLPTWVVDWSSHESTPEALTSTSRKWFTAGGGGFDLIFSFDVVEKTMTLAGMPFDKIAYVCKSRGPQYPYCERPSLTATGPANPDEVDQEKLKLQADAENGSWLSEWLSNHDRLKDIDAFRIPNSLENLTGRTWLTDIVYQPTDEPLLAAFRRTLMTDLYVSPERDTVERFTNQAETNWEFMRAYRRAFSRSIGDRRFVISVSGFMGLAPQSVEVGDSIFVPFGNDTPILIRALNEKDGFMYIGDCYVHGIMNGEIWGELGQRDETGNVAFELHKCKIF